MRMLQRLSLLIVLALFCTAQAQDFPGKPVRLKAE